RTPLRRRKTKEDRPPQAGQRTGAITHVCAAMPKPASRQERRLNFQSSSRSEPASAGLDRGARVLIVVHTTTFLTELTPFGKLLRERAGAETIFYCPFVHWTAERFADECARDGVICLLNPVRQCLARNGFELPADRAAAASLRHGLGRFTARVARKLT